MQFTLSEYYSTCKRKTCVSILCGGKTKQAEIFYFPVSFEFTTAGNSLVCMSSKISDKKKKKLLFAKFNKLVSL